MKSLSKVLLALYSFTMMWLILFKFALPWTSAFGYDHRSINVIPFNGMTVNDLQEPLANCLFFIPLGLLMSVVFKQVGLLRKFGMVMVFSLVAEIAQYVFAIGTTDITDVITNTLGGFLGLAIYDEGKTQLDGNTLDRTILIFCTLLLVLCVALLCALVSRGVRYQ